MDNWPADKVERRGIKSLIPYAKNARTHSDAQVAQIAASMKEWGWTNPILVDEEGVIIAGHGRLLAAQRLGLDEAPVMVAEGWTEAQKRAYTLADNKLALNAGWDDEILRLELSDLDAAGFGWAGIGFDEKEWMGTQFDAGAALDEMPALRDGDKEPFQQKTFTLHDEQASVVDDALMLARTSPLSDTGLNENSNGNALALICGQWLDSQRE
jgi:ParB family transcriptional regulator, chromosome partitioning protein